MGKKSGGIPTKAPQAGVNALHQAIALHRAGDIQGAYLAYTKILLQTPGNLDALMNLSTLESQRGNYEEAERLLIKLLPQVPKNAYIRFAYGNVLMKLKKYEEALASFNHAIRLEPKNATYHYNQGVALDALQRFEEALDSYEEAIKLQPTHTEALLNRANDFFRGGRYEEALEACNQILAVNPSLAIAYTTRGNALGGLKRVDEALADYERAIALEPRSAVAHNNRGNLLKNEQAADALASYDHALAIQPNYADAHNNRATALNKLERFAEALISSDAALAINPNSSSAHDTRGNALAGLRRFDEALASYDRSLELDPKQVNSYWNKTLLTLLLGDYEQGWKLYEHRWRTEFQKDNYRQLDMPLWLGDAPLEGKKILIHPEQGFGDFIQFSRYVPLLVERGAFVILETLPPLLPVMTPCFSGPNVLVVETGKPMPVFDYHCPIMSLPLAFNTRVETIPTNIPYLWALPEKKAEWQQKLGPQTKARIGLVWSGATAHLNDHNRSIPLKKLETLLQLPFEFHSLQKEVRTSDEPSMHYLRNHADDLKTFADTAGLIDAMDLCISVDTSVAHLVGAMGKALWVMLPFTPDYRWLMERSDSVWYPTANLFRQPVRGDWDTLIQTMTAMLGDVLG